MIIGRKKTVRNNSLLGERSAKSIRYAMERIKKSALAPYAKNLYLYGSCARQSQSYLSDVDLFLVVDDTCDARLFHEEIFILRGSVIPEDTSLPEVDLYAVRGEAWRDNKLEYYRNIEKEGIEIWEK